jgi:signal transduction histidine kinase
VIDEGAGLTAEQLTHAFEPFFSTKKQGHGTGLGLPIVEEIVRAHRGEVEMRSVVGRGTEAIVRLPLAVAGPQTVEEATTRAS